MKTNERAYHAFEEVARRKGIPVDEVIHCVDEMIKDTLSDAHKRGDQELLNTWREIPSCGSQPTAIELLNYLYRRCVDKMNDF